MNATSSNILGCSRMICGYLVEPQVTQGGYWAKVRNPNQEYSSHNHKACCSSISTNIIKQLRNVGIYITPTAGPTGLYDIAKYIGLEVMSKVTSRPLVKTEDEFNRLISFLCVATCIAGPGDKFRISMLKSMCRTDNKKEVCTSKPTTKRHTMISKFAKKAPNTKSFFNV